MESKLCVIIAFFQVIFFFHSLCPSFFVFLDTGPLISVNMGERVCGDQRNICTKLVPLHKPKYPQTISNKRRLKNNIFLH